MLKEGSQLRVHRNRAGRLNHSCVKQPQREIPGVNRRRLLVLQDLVDDDFPAFIHGNDSVDGAIAA